MSGDESTSEFLECVNDNVGREFAERFRLETPTDATGCDTGIASSLNVDVRITDHPRIFRAGIRFASKCIDSDAVRLLVIEAVAAINLEEEIGHPKALHDAAAGPDRLVCKHGELRTRCVEAAERIVDTRIKGCVIQSVMAVVIDEEFEGARHILIRCVRAHRALDQDWRAVADK